VLWIPGEDVFRCRCKLIFLAAVQLLATGTSKSADSPPTNDSQDLPRVIVTGQAEPESLTSPSAGTAAEQKSEVPGGFTLRNAEEMERGRASNFEDLLKRTPGLFLQTDNGTEVTKVSIRGSGILFLHEQRNVKRAGRSN
jgi:outer membrane receptor for Fe3+-dicitrate